MLSTAWAAKSSGGAEMCKLVMLGLAGGHRGCQQGGHGGSSTRRKGEGASLSGSSWSKCRARDLRQDAPRARLRLMRRLESPLWASGGWTEAAGSRWRKARRWLDEGIRFGVQDPGGIFLIYAGLGGRSDLSGGFLSGEQD